MKKIFLTLLTAAVIAPAMISAAPWAVHNSRRTPTNLVVIGNYKTSRLMADTIFRLTNQPYLLVALDGRLFIRLPKVTMQIPADKVDVYINRLNPRRLVIIGDERMVTYEFEQKLRRINLRRIPVVRIYADNWKRVAEELDDLLNIGNLSKYFNKAYDEMGQLDPRLSPAAPAAAVPEAVAPAAADPAAEQPVAAEPPAADTAAVPPVDPEK